MLLLGIALVLFLNPTMMLTVTLGGFALMLAALPFAMLGIEAEVAIWLGVLLLVAIFAISSARGK